MYYLMEALKANFLAYKSICSSAVVEGRRRQRSDFDSSKWSRVCLDYFIHCHCAKYGSSRTQ
jgi:hypothetical protein